MTSEQDTNAEQGDPEPGTAPASSTDPDENITDEPVYNDRSKLDFNPDDGLYTGTAVTGATDIPGEHERVDDVESAEGDDDSDG